MCQQRDWREGHKHPCRAFQAQEREEKEVSDVYITSLTSVKTKILETEVEKAGGQYMAGCECQTCLEAAGTVHGGCGCRGTAGHIHVECVAAFCSTPGVPTVCWKFCQTCKETYDAPVRLQLAERWIAKVSTLARDDDERMNAVSNHAICLLKAKQPSKASKLLRANLRWAEPLLGPHDEGILAMKSNLGSALLDTKQFDKAVDLLHETFEHKKAVLGRQHASTIQSGKSLAGCMLSAGWSPDTLEDAEEIMLANMAILRQGEEFGPDHKFTIMNELLLGAILEKRGRDELAVRLLREVACQAVSVFGHLQPFQLEVYRQIPQRLRSQVFGSDGPPWPVVGQARTGFWDNCTYMYNTVTGEPHHYELPTADASAAV